ncbi:hypothetical protein S7711_05567 [Stachybotrys chartarum IBT 7711]|uniref:RING-type domain-containing protein n=1 Tax=Stachybotrys chartarum (strain CBS 109288 / IBT 7711) TaxID=1280523 RepID=A0A084AKA8_STACB|nr:hypothetical protein S7711_05567 [Stachybotrys chartarum IBT 7711]KFA80973.1 hypothetical protein S40288_00816 [Stachybotrys chartarum IBT 40288]
MSEWRQLSASDSTEDITEELTIQEIILKSLEGEQFDGIEVERTEATQEIQRLKALLTARNAHPHNPHPGEGGRLSRHATVNETANYSPSHRGSSRAAGPSSLAGMATPSRRSDVWSSPARSLPSRKREFRTTHLDSGEGASKSRRTSPTPTARHYGSPFGNEIDDLDIIDLTGDDIHHDSNFVARQMLELQRSEQERRDRDLALQLSRQDAAPAASAAPATPSSQEPQVNAFTRLMSSQPDPVPFHQYSGMADPFQQATSLANDQGDPSSSSSRSQPMPGAYDPSWDQPFRNAQPSASQHLSSGQRAGSHMPFYTPGLPNSNSPFGTPDHPGMGGGQFFPSPVPSTNSTPGLASSPGFGHLPYRYPGGLPHRGFSRPSIQDPSGVGMPGVPQSPLSLGNIIQRTSMFDYASGMDYDGNPLPPRLMNCLDDTNPRLTEKELDDLLTNIRPDMEISQVDRGNTPAGLRNTLYPHQELALTWMKKMEEGTNKGGILADDMGLGKTITTLSLMLARPAPLKSRPKTNLIIAPLALVRQWEEEIHKKTKITHKLSVFIYHNKKATTDELLLHDVVLTTYGTIATELKRLEKFLKDNEGREIDFNDRTLTLRCPLLHPKKASFYRVILDEAQCIKNRDTQTAKACHKLKATHRWCLTGTPMMNGVLELHSLVCFLKIKPYCHWEQFRSTFGALFGRRGDPKHVAMSRLRALLKAIMLRRKKDSKLDGKPILNLPPKSEEIIIAGFSPEERQKYATLEENSQKKFNNMVEKGTVGKNYSSLLVLLLRLRQSCCHPYLTLDAEEAAAVVTEDLRKIVKGLDSSTVQRIKDIEAFECPICQDAVQCPSFFVPCGHDTCQQCLARIVDSAANDNLREGNESSKAKCPLCRGLFDPKQCFTYDTFREIHMPETVAKSERDVDIGDDASSDGDSDSVYESDDEADHLGNLRGFIVPDDDEEEFPDDPTTVAPRAKVEPNLENGTFMDPPKSNAKQQRRRRKKKTKENHEGKKEEIRGSKLKALRKESYKSHDAFKKYMRYLRKTFVPSAKVTACMKLLHDIQEADKHDAQPGGKIIVFSQWTLYLDMLEVAMWHDKFSQPVRYDGSMSGEERFDAARRFRDDKRVKVMLVSLRAGNAGLNLTSASRVIIMDPFWNPYVEMQAVDRAHRIGQERPVKVYRILTEGTVEDRIIELQEKKKSMVEAALDEKESMKIGRLGVNELKFLFNSSR